MMAHSLVLVACLLFFVKDTDGLNIFNKMTTCNVTYLKGQVDTCTSRYSQPYYLFLPSSITSNLGQVGEQTFVSNTGIDYHQVFLQVNSYKCTSRQLQQQIDEMKCRYAKMMSCLPPYYRKFLPDQNRIKEGMNYLCAHRQELNQGCDTSRMGEVNRCVKDKDQVYYTEDEDVTDEDRMCRTYAYARECMTSSLSLCSSSLQDLSLKVMDYLRPTFCAAQQNMASLAAILVFATLARAASNMFLY